jgi:hypothetical protein
MFSELRIDVRITDKEVFSVIKRHADAKTRKAVITVFRLSEIVGCHVNTVTACTKRLEAAGKIKRHGGKNRRGMEYEVLKDDDT